MTTGFLRFELRLIFVSVKNARPYVAKMLRCSSKISAPLEDFATIDVLKCFFFCLLSGYSIRLV